MRVTSQLRVVAAVIFALILEQVALAADLDVIGVNLLRQVDVTLLGNGISVAQPEALEGTNSPPAFEVNPALTGQPVNLFTYRSALGTATNFPNNVGNASSHAGNVAFNFYSLSGGVAPQIGHIDNYDADYFYQNIITPLLPSIAAPVVNQSFIFDTAEETLVNQNYDNYAAQHGTLFVSGIGNGDVPVSAAGTCYNGIGVGVSDGASSSGPTSDGRCKPDLVAPGRQTSFSTPYVAGAATVLLQAANRGDGGTNLAAAADLRTLKALLLNGAVKPVGWTNGPTTPLDGRHGAGVLNVFNSWKQLSGGKCDLIESTTVSSDTSHPPGANTNNSAALTGWDLNNLATSPTQDKVNHYYFNLPADSGQACTVNATLTWQRQLNHTTVNDLNLFLYAVTNNSLIAASTSTVDNVEHLYISSLAGGRYDLQVLKRGSPAQISTTETYALAFEFSATFLNATVTDSSLRLTWPLAPAGFHLQSATNLTAPVSWNDVSESPLVSGGSNVVTLPAGGARQYFRLQRP